MKIDALVIGTWRQRAHERVDVLPTHIDGLESQSYHHSPLTCCKHDCTSVSVVVVTEATPLVTCDYVPCHRWVILSTSCCHAGVIVCSSVDLTGTMAVGTIPATISALAALQTLALSSTGVNGTFPAEVAVATALTRLALHDTALSGTIPASLSGLRNLIRLEVFNNPGLAGTLPSVLSSIASLQCVACTSDGFVL